MVKEKTKTTPKTILKKSLPQILFPAKTKNKSFGVNRKSSIFTTNITEKMCEGGPFRMARERLKAEEFA